MRAQIGSRERGGIGLEPRGGLAAGVDLEDLAPRSPRNRGHARQQLVRGAAHAPPVTSRACRCATIRSAACSGVSVVVSMRISGFSGAS